MLKSVNTLYVETINKFDEEKISRDKDGKFAPQGSDKKDESAKEIMDAMKLKSRILHGRDPKELSGSFEGEKIKEIDRYIKTLGEKAEISKLPDAEQVKLTEQGIKPLTLTHLEIKTTLPHVDYDLNQVMHKEGKVTKVEVIPTKIYFKEENRERAEKAKSLSLKMNSHTNNLKVGDTYTTPKFNDRVDQHREMGQLLGYKKEEIEDFINRNKEK